MNTTLRLMLIAGLMMCAPVSAQQGGAAKPVSGAAEEAPTDATSAGALKLFTQAMKEGNFQKVSELVDPASEGYEDFLKMVEHLDPATANPNIEPAMLDQIRGMFTKPWQTIETEVVAEQGSRAQYKIHFFDVDPKTKEKREFATKTADLNKINENWRVIMTTTLMQPYSPAAGAPAAPAPSPTTPAPTTPAPAEAPAKPNH